MCGICGVRTLIMGNEMEVHKAIRAIGNVIMRNEIMGIVIKGNVIMGNVIMGIVIIGIVIMENVMHQYYQKKRPIFRP